MSDDAKMNSKDGDEIATVHAMTALSEIADQLRELASVLHDLSTRPLAHFDDQDGDQDADQRFGPPQSDGTMPTLH